MNKAPPTELAHRVNGGMEVTLFWHRDGDELVVSVADPASGDAFAFEVDSAIAVEAFYHPYAYAALFGIYFDPEPTGSSGDLALKT